MINLLPLFFSQFLRLGTDKRNFRSHEISGQARKKDWYKVGPVKVPKIIVVLIGVLITQALMAALQLTIAKVASTAGKR